MGDIFGVPIIFSTSDLEDQTNVVYRIQNPTFYFPPINFGQFCDIIA